MAKKKRPDILLLQELKAQQDDIPRTELEDLNYNFITFGQKAYNGVAILSKYPVPESAPNATPFDILVCESPPIIIDQSSTVISFKTLCITSVKGAYLFFGSLPVIKPKFCINFISLGVFS